MFKRFREGYAAGHSDGYQTGLADGANGASQAEGDQLQANYDTGLFVGYSTVLKELEKIKDADRLMEVIDGLRKAVEELGP